MTRTFSKLFAAGLISAVVGFSGGPLGNTAQAAEPEAGHPGCVDANTAQELQFCRTGDAMGAIHVTSGNNTAWTTVQPAAILFPAHVFATAPEGEVLHFVQVFQGNILSAEHMIHHPNVVGHQSHQFDGALLGGSVHLSNDEKAQLVATCNASLNQAAENQQQHQFTTDIPLTRAAQTMTGDGIVAEGIDYDDLPTVTNYWPVTVICDPFTRQIPTDKTAVLPDPEIMQVELGLSTTGAVVGGTLEYTGSCPMGVTLNMRWVTNIGAELKTYIKHKDVAGKHNWTSQTFSVNTNQPAYGGNWKKEMTDLIMIPFTGAVPSNGPGGANAHNLPNGGYQFNPGSGGGFNPATSLGASNSGTSNGLTQYIGFFQLVAYKSKKVVPVLLPGGGLSNTTIYEGQKMSGWRKYIVTCEPQQNTSIPQGPTGVFNPGQQDTHQIDTAGGLVTTHPATNTRRIPVVPGVVTTGQNNKAADIVRKRDEDARRKAIAAALAKRKAIAAALAKRKAIAAALAKRKAIAAALAKRKAVVALAKRKAIAAALARRKAALKRSTVAPVRTMRIRRR